MPENEAKFFSYISKRAFVRLMVFSFLGSLILITILGLNANWKELVSNLSMPWLIVAGSGLALMQYVSGYRLYCLIPSDSSYSKTLYLDSVKIMALFQILLKILPFRLGEAGFFWLNKKFLRAPFETSLGIFLTFRLWDLRVVASCFLIFGGVVLDERFSWGRPFLLMVGVLSLALFTLSSIRLIRLGEWFFQRVSQITPRLHGAIKISETLSASISHLERLNSLKQNITIGALSFLMWFMYYAVIYSLFRAVGLDMNWYISIAIASGTVLIGILPVQTIGGLGLMEFGQASLLMLAGLSSSVAASKSLAVGLCFWGLCLIAPAVAMMPSIFLAKTCHDFKADT